MSERAYKNISIKSEFAETIEEFIRRHPEHGYRSIAAFLEDASRRRLESLKASEPEFPRMEQVNFDENGVKILDRKIHRVADVSFKRTGVHCEVDDSEDCEHIRFALAQKEVQKLIRQKRALGWKLPDV